VEATCATGPLSITRNKTVLNLAVQVVLAEGLAAEPPVVQCYATQLYDVTEGLAAFAERRPPRFQAR
jgi:hypothetical protein